MRTCSVFSPAKVNFFLAVTGRRPDGFHELVSVAAPLEFGDTVRLEAGRGDGDTIGCAMPGVPVDGRNLVLRAASAWRDAGGVAPPVRFVLEKQIPPESGLGGGSSNAVAALRGLQQIATEPLGEDALGTVAAALGSDCPLFLPGAPVIMRGRGERVSLLDPAATDRLRATDLIVCRPGVGIDTAWAYGRLAAGAPGTYLDAVEAGRRVGEWLAGSPTSETQSLNSFEPVVFGKFVALPVLAERLRKRHGLTLRLSGSGSACFAWLPPGTDWDAVASDVRDAFGRWCLVTRTRVRAPIGNVDRAPCPTPRSVVFPTGFSGTDPDPRAERRSSPGAVPGDLG